MANVATDVANNGPEILGQGASKFSKLKIVVPESAIYLTDCRSRSSVAENVTSKFHHGERGVLFVVSSCYDGVLQR